MDRNHYASFTQRVQITCPTWHREYVKHMRLASTCLVVELRLFLILCLPSLSQYGLIEGLFATAVCYVHKNTEVQGWWGSTAQLLAKLEMKTQSSIYFQSYCLSTSTLVLLGSVQMKFLHVFSMWVTFLLCFLRWNRIFPVFRLCLVILIKTRGRECWTPVQGSPSLQKAGSRFSRKLKQILLHLIRGSPEAHLDT